MPLQPGTFFLIAKLKTASHNKAYDPGMNLEMWGWEWRSAGPTPGPLAVLVRKQNSELKSCSRGTPTVRSMGDLGLKDKKTR